MTWLEPFVGAIASISQKFFFDNIKDNNIRLVIAVVLCAVGVLIYNFLLSKWFDNILTETTSAIGAGYLFYKSFLEKK